VEALRHTPTSARARINPCAGYRDRPEGLPRPIPVNDRVRLTGVIRQAARQAVLPRSEKARSNTESGRMESSPSTDATAGFVAKDSPTSLPVACYGLIAQLGEQYRGRETMRGDPWTANRDKDQQKVTIPPRRKPTAETASPQFKPTVSGPLWIGKIRTRCPKTARGRRRAPRNRQRTLRSSVAVDMSESAADNRRQRSPP
jgi:hypothetical protein